LLLLKRFVLLLYVERGIWRLPHSEPAKIGETHDLLLGFVRCIFDGVFTGDIGYNNVHPPLIAFLNITKVPVFPSPAFCFGCGNS